MADNSEPTPLDEVIADYLRKEEAGQDLDPEEWIRRHPDLAAGLRAFFQDLSVLRQPVDRSPPTPRERTARINLMDKPFAPGVKPRPRPRVDRVSSPVEKQQFDDYELGDEIARGAMGIVYRARQVSLDRHVALKMMKETTFAHADDVQRFRREARAAGRLEHANIVPIYDVGECRGRQYYTMRWIPGGDLSRVMDDLRTDSHRAARLLATVARAVDHAHQHGVLHRDLKPANILLDAEGTPHVTDFGLAKRMGESSGLTLTGQVMGTASYMSPEQACGNTKRVTPASDVYSLGAVLYEMLTGNPPFVGENPMEVLFKVCEEEPVHPSIENPSVDRDLATICMKCLEKNPSLRYPTAKALAEDLESWLTQRPILARPPTPLRRVVRWSTRHLTVLATAGMAVILAITAVLAVHWRQNVVDLRRPNRSSFARSDLERTRALDIAYMLVEKRKYGMARDMFQEAMREAQTPDDILEVHEGLRILANIRQGPDTSGVEEQK